MPAPSRLAKFSLLFSLALVVVLLASPAPAQALSHGDHFGHHKRMVKIYQGAHPHKRADKDDGALTPNGASSSTAKQGGQVEGDDGANSTSQKGTKVNAQGVGGNDNGGLGRVSGAGANPNDPNPKAEPSPASSSSTLTRTTPTSSADPSNTPIIPISLPIGPSSSASDLSSSSASESSTTSDTTTSTTETSTSTTPTSSSTPPPQITPSPDADTSSTPPPPLTETVHVTGAHTPVPTPIVGAAQTTSNIRKTLTVVIALGASVAVVAIAWNLFRRWKLRPSKSFDSRIAPVDWQPTNDHEETMFEKQQRRRFSGSSFRSFDSQGHSVQTHTTGHAGLPPAHDFTAGPSHLAVNGGYADLQRGRSPSPGPQMMQQNGGYRDYHQGH